MNRRLLTLILIIPFLYGFSWRGSKINEGNRLLKAGKKEEALKLYRDAQIDDPQNSVIFYNVGNALAGLGKYQEAESEFLKALQTKDKPLEAKTYYNLGNNYYRQGKYEEAIKMYEKALDLDSQDEDAKYNLELVRKKIKEMMNNQEKRQEEQAKQPHSPEKQDKEQNKGTAGKQKDKKEEKDKTADNKDKSEVEEKEAEKKSEEKPKAGNKEKEKDMNKEDALRILNALNQSEKDLMRNARPLAGDEAMPEKDW